MEYPVLTESQQLLVDSYKSEIRNSKINFADLIESETDKTVCKALACFALEEFPDRLFLIKTIAARLGNLRMHPEAMALFAYIMEKDSSDVHAVSEYCRSLHFNNQSEELLEISERFLPQPDPEDQAQMLYWKAVALLNLDRVAESIEPGLEAVTQWPDNFWLLFNLGYAYYTQQDYENALHYYNGTIRVKPGFRIPYLNKACIYSLQGKYQESYLCLMHLYDFDKPYFRSTLKDEELAGLFNSEYGPELKALMKDIPEVAEEDLDDGDDDD